MARGHGSINAFILSCVAAFAIAGTAACQNTARGLKQDAQQVEQATRDDRAHATAKSKKMGSDAARAANQAGEEIAERTGAAWHTIDVKGALMTNASVDATRIDVDTDYRTKTVTLNGSVPTDNQRAAAEAIARSRAKGYTVVNNLQVQPR